MLGGGGHNTVEVGAAKVCFPFFPSEFWVRYRKGHTLGWGPLRFPASFLPFTNPVFLLLLGPVGSVAARIRVWTPVYPYVLSSQGAGVPMWMHSMSGSGCGVPSWDFSQHQYPGGGAYQSLKLQFRNSSSSPGEAAGCTRGWKGSREARYGCFSLKYSPFLALPGDVGNRGWIRTNQ